MTVSTVGFKYEKGEYALTQGHKERERFHRNSLGRYVCPCGYGWANEYKPSKIIVYIDVDGRREEVWVDHFFKNNWGRITIGRLEAIRNSMPETLEVEVNFSRSNEVYYTAEETSMMGWLTNAKKIR